MDVIWKGTSDELQASVGQRVLMKLEVNRLWG